MGDNKALEDLMKTSGNHMKSAMKYPEAKNEIANESER